MIEKMLTVSIKNTIQPIHWHDFLEINFVLEGEMDVVRNNRQIHVESGEMMVLNRDDVHSISSESDELLYVQIHIEMEHFNMYIPDIWTVLIYCSPENNDTISKNLKSEMKSHIGSIIRYMEEQSSNVDAENRIIYYCVEILSNLKMGFLASVDDKLKEVSEEQKSRIWKAIDYMYDNHNRKLTLHEVAQWVFVSDDYLSRLLKKHNDMGFESFLAFIRSEMSIRLLLNTNLSITNIAYECGFSAPKYYNAAFLRIYGCEPTEYRKKNKSNFLIEKQHETPNILWDEGVDREYAHKCLKKYERIYGESNVIKKTIEIDISAIATATASTKTAEELNLPGTQKGTLWSYNIQKSLAEIQRPFSQPERNLFIWKEGEAIKIMVVNVDVSGGTEYLLKFTGLDETATYIYCREKTPNVPTSIKRIVNGGKIKTLNRDIIHNVFNMTLEYGEISLEHQAYMNMELGEEQVAKITIQKIK